MEKEQFFIDYFAYGTNILTDFISEELLSSRKSKESRFYKNNIKCDRSFIQTEPRIETLNTFSVRLNKEKINECLEDWLPIDAKIQRIDFAIDTDDQDFARSFVIGNFDYGVVSETGITYYFGDRTSAVYERVYFLNERGHWRYELEYKPREGRECKVFDSAHVDIKILFAHIEKLKILNGSAKRGIFEPLTKKQKEWIDFHFESPFVPIDIEFYKSLNQNEREYFEKRCKCRVLERAELWKEKVKQYKSYKKFLESI